MAAALFLDRKKGLPLLILASYALAACCTVSFASSGYPGQIAAIVSAMLDGLSTEAAMCQARACFSESTPSALSRSCFSRLSTAV